MSRIIRAILSFGPGIFAIGYTIGTGSVTGSVANRAFFDISMFTNTVKIDVFENAKQDKQLFATEPECLILGSLTVATITRKQNTGVLSDKTTAITAGSWRRRFDLSSSMADLSPG